MAIIPGLENNPIINSISGGFGLGGLANIFKPSNLPILIGALAIGTGIAYIGRPMYYQWSYPIELRILQQLGPNAQRWKKDYAKEYKLKDGTWRTYIAFMKRERERLPNDIKLPSGKKNKFIAHLYQDVNGNLSPMPINVYHKEIWTPKVDANGAPMFQQRVDRAGQLMFENGQPMMEQLFEMKDEYAAMFEPRSDANKVMLMEELKRYFNEHKEKPKWYETPMAYIAAIVVTAIIALYFVQKGCK